MLSYEDRNNKPMWKVNQMQQPNNKILFYSSAKTMKWLALICGAISVGYMAYQAYKKYRQWQSRREMLRAISELRAARERGVYEDNDAQACVICISNPREVVVLDCGHICLCLSCADALPHPRLCPICRQNVRRIIPVYVS